MYLTPAQLDTINNLAVPAFMAVLLVIAGIAMWIDKDITKEPKNDR